MANQGKVLMTGATGNVASGLIPALRKEGVPIRALVRDESKAQSLRSQGVEVVIGDLDQPETLEAAFDGVHKVYLLTGVNSVAVQQASNAIAAGKRAGVAHLVRQSALVPAPITTTRLGRMHAATDAEIAASGLPYTLLQPTFFMQNLMMAAQTIAADGMLYMPFKEGRLGMIDVRDIVDSAVAVLKGEGHEGKTYLLTGPASVSLDEAAGAFSRALGKSVTYMDVSPEMGTQSMTAAGFPQWVAEAYAELFVNFAANGADFATDHVRRLTGHTPRSIDDFVRDFAPFFGATAAA